MSCTTSSASMGMDNYKPARGDYFRSKHGGLGLILKVYDCEVTSQKRIDYTRVTPQEIYGKLRYVASNVTSGISLDAFLASEFMQQMFMDERGILTTKAKRKDKRA